MKRNFANILENGQEQAQAPGIQGRMRLAAHVDHAAQERSERVVGMQRLDLRVLGFGQIVDVVALNGLVQKRQPQSQNEQRDDD